jgi:DNA-directed RNA polymerase subunit RPC12/RpoP
MSKYVCGNCGHPNMRFSVWKNRVQCTKCKTTLWVDFKDKEFYEYEGFNPRMFRVIKVE